MRFYIALFLLLATSLVEDVAASRGGRRSKRAQAALPTITQGKEQSDTQVPIITDSNVVTDTPVTIDLTSGDDTDPPVTLPETVDLFPACTFNNNYKTADLLYPNFMYSYCSIETVDLLTNSTPVCTFDNETKAVHHLYPNLYSYCSIDNIVEWLTCPEGLVFVEEMQICDLDLETADLFTNSTPACTFDNEEKTTHHLHPNLYSYCSINNVIMWSICPDGFVFGEAKQKCEEGEKQSLQVIQQVADAGIDTKRALEETRRNAQAAADAARKQAQEVAEEALRQAQKAAEDAKKRLEEARRNAQEVAQKAAEVAKRTFEENRKKAQEAAEVARRQAQKIAEAARRQALEAAKVAQRQALEAAEAARRQAQEAADAARRHAQYAANAARNAADAARRQAQDAINSARNRISSWSPWGR